MDTRQIRQGGMTEQLGRAASAISARISLGACLGLAFVAVLVVLALGMSLVQQSTSKPPSSQAASRPTTNRR